MSTVKVNELSTYSGTDISVETGKTISGTASQFKMTDVVQGDVLYGSAADTLSRLAAGTAGQVYKRKVLVLIQCGLRMLKEKYYKLFKPLLPPLQHLLHRLHLLI